MKISIYNIYLGQSLWDVRYGKVSVTKLKGDYPISAVTQNGTTLHYDEEGKACIGHNYPVLYTKNPINEIS